MLIDFYVCTDLPRHTETCVQADMHITLHCRTLRFEFLFVILSKFDLHFYVSL